MHTDMRVGISQHICNVIVETDTAGTVWEDKIYKDKIHYFPCRYAVFACVYVCVGETHCVRVESMHVMDSEREGARGH